MGCNVTDLQPITNYSPQVVIYNSVGSGTPTEWMSITTHKGRYVRATPAEKNGTKAVMSTFYTELWFVILMCVLGLILLAIFLSLILQRKLNKQACTRERPPLVPLQKRMVPVSLYSPNETYSDLAETKIPGSVSHISGQSQRRMSILRIPSQSQISLSYSQNSLQHVASQLIDFHDRKSLIEDSVWDSIIHGHKNGMYVPEDDPVNTVKGFSTMTKEQTAFTDTHL